MTHRAKNLTNEGRDFIAFRIGNPDFCAQGLLTTEGRTICLTELEAVFSRIESKAA